MIVYNNLADIPSSVIYVKANVDSTFNGYFTGDTIPYVSFSLAAMNRSLAAIGSDTTARPISTADFISRFTDTELQNTLASTDATAKLTVFKWSTAPTIDLASSTSTGVPNLVTLGILTSGRAATILA